MSKVLLLLGILSEYFLTSGTVTVSLTPQSINASVGQQLEFTCTISDLPHGHHLENYTISIGTIPSISDLKQMIASDSPDGVNSKKAIFRNTTEAMDGEVVRVCCTVTNNINSNLKLFCTNFTVQGILAAVGNLTRTEVDPCTLHFTWTAPYTLQGVPIRYYTINITRHSDGAVLRSDTTNTTEYYYSAVSSLGETLEVVVAAVNDVGIGNTSTTIVQNALSFNDFELSGSLTTAVRDNTTWNYLFNIIIPPACKDIVSAVQVCIKPRSCVNGSHYVSIDGTLSVEAMFDAQLTEDMKYDVTIYVMFNGTAEEHQPLPIRNIEISTFDVQRIDINTNYSMPVNDPLKVRFCFTVEFIEGYVEYTVILKCTTMSCECVSINRTLSYEFCMEILPGIYDIKITDSEAIDDIIDNPALTLPGYYLPGTNMNQSNDTCPSSEATGSAAKTILPLTIANLLFIFALHSILL